VLAYLAHAITDGDHVAKVRVCRRFFQSPRIVTTHIEKVRDLADNDAAFGVDFDHRGSPTGGGRALRAPQRKHKKELAHLAHALKAPRLLAATQRLVTIARAVCCHEEYLAAVFS
jgi:hypothetical protein